MSHVTLEATQVQEKLSSFVMSDNWYKGKQTFVEFTISTEQDLRDFSARWVLQARCTLEDHGRDTEFSTPVWGPFYNEYDVSKKWRLPEDFTMTKRADGRFQYQLYAFPNFMASEFRDHEWFPVPIANIVFDQVHCYLIGVTKAPVIFPRSNELTLSRGDLLAMLPSDAQ